MTTTRERILLCAFTALLSACATAKDSSTDPQSQQLPAYEIIPYELNDNVVQSDSGVQVQGALFNALRIDRVKDTLARCFVFLPDDQNQKVVGQCDQFVVKPGNMNLGSRATVRSVTMPWSKKASQTTWFINMKSGEIEFCHDLARCVTLK